MNCSAFTQAFISSCNCRRSCGGALECSQCPALPSPDDCDAYRAKFVAACAAGRAASRAVSSVQEAITLATQTMNVRAYEVELAAVRQQAAKHAFDNATSAAAAAVRPTAAQLEAASHAVAEQVAISRNARIDLARTRERAAISCPLETESRRRLQVAVDAQSVADSALAKVSTRDDVATYVRCFNGGTCVDAIATFTCTCAPLWVGRYCEKVI